MDIHIIKLQNHIVESSEKSLINKISKNLLGFEFKTNHSIKSRSLKYPLKEILSSLQNMETYCLSCRKHTDNIGPKK